MREKCFDWTKEIMDYIDNNIIKILMSISIAMIFVIANSKILIYAALFSSWFLAFFSLFVIGYMLAYVILSFVFRIIGK
jgi:phosphoglycerol transferase MdoB-like AlkP superfamily enzyme